jgi:hypothetical protein
MAADLPFPNTAGFNLGSPSTDSGFSRAPRSKPTRTRRPAGRQKTTTRTRCLSADHLELSWCNTITGYNPIVLAILRMDLLLILDQTPSLRSLGDFEPSPPERPGRLPDHQGGKSARRCLWTSSSGRSQEFWGHCRTNCRATVFLKSVDDA